MPDPVRLRQICLVSQDLEWTSNMLCNAFDAVVVFQDPHSILHSLLPAPTLLRSPGAAASQWRRAAT